MTETSNTFEIGQTVILITTKERVVFLGQNSDGTQYVIGRAGETDTVTVDADYIISTEDFTLELAVEAHVRVRRVRSNMGLWKKASKKSMELQREYADMTGKSLKDVGDIVADLARNA